MHDYFDRLFRFNNWANQVIGTYLLDHHIQDENCVQLMSHLTHAQINWFKRISNQQQDNPVWDLIDLISIPGLLADNGSLWLAYIQQLEANQWSQPLAYANLAGQPMLNTVQDILAHVVNHATYHRGQIIRRIRELNYVPPSTDFIIYARLYPMASQ